MTVQEMGRLGGTARMAAMSKRELSEFGRRAVNIRWSKVHKDIAKTTAKTTARNSGRVS